ncbi:MAG: glycosyltransferase [Bacteriovoracaceae bacterium]
MILRLYVHDLHAEIGHSRATIDLLNHLSEEERSSIESLEVVAFTTSPLQQLFPKWSQEKKWIKVPCPKLYPFLIKSIFYQIWTLLYHLSHLKKNVVSLSVGIAFPLPQIVNIQFIHHHWDELNTIYQKSSWYKKFYKKILFSYFRFCENLIYRRKNMFFLVLSNFTKQYLEKKFCLANEQAILTYSSVNPESFSLLSDNKDDLFKTLAEEKKYLQGINFNLPVFLFVGAYERKGLAKALEMLEGIRCQFVIIGKPEMGNAQIKAPEGVKIFTIPFTKKLNIYYNLADYFIFPTIYEPFGLVVLEAAATGLKLLIPRANLGASELLVNDKGTIFFEDGPIDFKNLVTLTKDERSKLVTERLEYFKRYSWQGSSHLFYQKILSRFSFRQ